MECTQEIHKEKMAHSFFLTEKCTSCNFVHILCSTVHGYSSHFKEGLLELHFLYHTHGLMGPFSLCLPPSPSLGKREVQPLHTPPFSVSSTNYACFWSEQNHFQSWRSVQWFLICEYLSWGKINILQFLSSNAMVFPFSLACPQSNLPRWKCFHCFKNQNKKDT